MTHASERLERLFRACFFARYATVLVGGGAEPLYRPAAGGDAAPDRIRGIHCIVYRADYFASALHEVAHWCVAGARRRRLEDYGYWYEPDGRSAEQQAEFERVEARPQALEAIFAAACGSEFHLSADNLEGAAAPSAGFAGAVDEHRRRYERDGLPPRAAWFHRALLETYAGRQPANPALPGRVALEVSP